MTKNAFKIGGKAIPVWLLIVGLLASGAGAAAGTILAGKVTGTIPVAASQALLTGTPINQLPTDPHFAIEDISDADFDENPTGTWPLDDFTPITDFSALVYSDSAYEATIPVNQANKAQQMYKFYVGPEANITNIDVTWKGYVNQQSDPAPAGRLKVWDGATWTNFEAEIPDTWNGSIYTDSTITINVTNLAGAIDADGYIYAEAFAIIIADGDTENLKTNQVYVTVTYKGGRIITLRFPDLSEGTMTQQLFDNIHQISLANRFIGVKSDDNTAFQAAAEIATGDWYEIQLPLKNASENDLVARLTLVIPDGLEVEVWSEPNGTITNVVREGACTWKFVVKAAAEYNNPADLLHIVVNADDDTMPGYYTITGTIKQIAY